jgi:AraC-like DNA-binding protein
VASLGGAVGLSRAALARRFAQFVGVPPMTYLTQWRLTLASDLLADGLQTRTRRQPARVPAQPGRPTNDLSPDVVAQVFGVPSFESSHQLELDVVAVSVLEQPAAGAQENRNQVDLQLVELVRLQQCLHRTRAAFRLWS